MSCQVSNCYASPVIFAGNIHFISFEVNLFALMSRIVGYIILQYGMNLLCLRNVIVVCVMCLVCFVWFVFLCFVNKTLEDKQQFKFERVCWNSNFPKFRLVISIVFSRFLLYLGRINVVIIRFL